MREILIAPQGRDAIEVGGFTAEDGKRFVMISFDRDGEERVIVSFEPQLFIDFAGHLGNVAKAAQGGNLWG